MGLRDLIRFRKGDQVETVDAWEAMTEAGTYAVGREGDEWSSWITRVDGSRSNAYGTGDRGEGPFAVGHDRRAMQEGVEAEMGPGWVKHWSGSVAPDEVDLLNTIRDEALSWDDGWA